MALIDPDVSQSFDYGLPPHLEAGVRNFINAKLTSVEALVSGALTPVPTPSGAISVAVGSAGALTGTFYYNVSYVTADGETSPWSGQPTGVSPSAQRVNLTNIPVSPDSRVIARKIWRSGTTEVRDIRLLATINDNTTTTYTDNDASALTTPAWWAGKSNSGLPSYLILGDTGSTGFGVGIFGNGFAGYACTAFGFEALKDLTTGLRNTAAGTYALENLTTGSENTAYGVHCGGGLLTTSSNTLYGYAAGGVLTDMGVFNCFAGHSAGGGTQKKGSNNTAFGSLALSSLVGGEWSNIVALGMRAGQYCNGSGQFFIDSRDRTNFAGNQDAGLMYGEISATPSAQRLRLNAFVRLGPPNTAGATASTVANLPAAAAALTGHRGYVTDANATTFYSVVAGGGANVVPVFCDGAAWRIA